MPKWSNSEVLDAALNIIATSDELAVCTNQPASYFEAVNPSAWSATTSKSLDDCVRPSVTRNGFTYRCTQAGTTGANEPVWPTTPDEIVTDGSAIWQVVSCLSLANVSLASADFSKDDATPSGRKITVSQKTGFVAHSSGTAAHIALINKANKKLMVVDTCPDQVITAGNPVNTGQFPVPIRVA